MRNGWIIIVCYVRQVAFAVVLLIGINFKNLFFKNLCRVKETTAIGGSKKISKKVGKSTKVILHSLKRELNLLNILMGGVRLF